jgi:transcriptional regulator with XRE-family HTH domain
MMFSSRLKLLRTQRKLTQEEMAEKIGVARTTYAMYEQNKREPDYETLQKIANFYGVSVDYLFGRSEQPAADLSKDDREMLAFFKDPKLNLFFKEMAQSEEGKLEQFRKIWEAIKDDIK